MLRYWAIGVRARPWGAEDAMAPSADDYRRQAEEILRWASDCDAVGKRLRAAAADLLKMAQNSSPSVTQQQQQQQIQPKDDTD